MPGEISGPLGVTIPIPNPFPYKHTRLRFNDTLIHSPALMINSISNLGGQIGPEVIGRLRSSSYDPDAAFYVLACFTFVSALLVLLATRRRINAR